MKLGIHYIPINGKDLQFNEKKICIRSVNTDTNYHTFQYAIYFNLFTEMKIFSLVI